jgi:hypothetical protein
MKRIVITFLLGSASIVLLASVLIHPNGLVKATQSNEPLLAGAEIDPAGDVDARKVVPELPFGKDRMAVL